MSSTKICFQNCPRQHIRKISEGSCDTKNWSNDAKRFDITGINYILKYSASKYKTAI